MLTAHAQARMQQRGIRADALECLLRYGREAYDHRGCVVLYLDKAARRLVQREADADTRKELSRLARTYAVLSGSGTVVTVGHRYRRITRS